MQTDDIVTRLRGQACPECGLPSTHNQFEEAADEIERLREEVSRLTLLANLWEAEFNAAVNAITGKAVTSDGTGKP
jgi:DNA repair exonuclease SbcCD ATPase subunit